MVPVLRVDDPHGRLVEAQLPCVSLERARDGAVRRVWEVNEALKTERRDRLHDEQERTTRLHKYHKEEEKKVTLALPVASQVLRLILDEEIEEDGLCGGGHHRVVAHIATPSVARAQHRV